MEIVREIRLTEEDRLALQMAFEIVNQINANSLTQKTPGEIFNNIYLACYEGNGNSYPPCKFEMEIFD